MVIDNRLLDPDLHARIATLSAAWQQILSGAPVARALDGLTGLLTERLAAGATIYPREPFRALSGLEPADVRIVILGQDPYHGPGQAQGLAFSVPDDIPRPPSLRNILAEISREYPNDDVVATTSPAARTSRAGATADQSVQGRLDLGPIPGGNDLGRWVDQGVLLLNTALTVEDGQPGSHARAGWSIVTDALIAGVAAQDGPTVFMLWGAHAQAKRALIPDNRNHLVLTANHPSPLSARRGPAPFMGCGHFSAANAWLAQHKYPEIAWKQHIKQ